MQLRLIKNAWKQLRKVDDLGWRYCHGVEQQGFYFEQGTVVSQSSCGKSEGNQRRSFGLLGKGTLRYLHHVQLSGNVDFVFGA